MTKHDVRLLGPFATLAGIWEGKVGIDKAPSDDRGVETNEYRERLVLEPIGLVENHEQKLQGLRYATTAWRLGESDPFHEEVGYWLWDAARKQAMKTFLVPRGISVIAGATVEPDARDFTLRATLGSPTYGICSNEFLNEQFRTVEFEVTIRILGADRFSYAEDTRMQMPGRKDVFHHTDVNTLERVG